MPRKPTRWKQPKHEKLVKRNPAPTVKKPKKAKPADPQLSLPLGLPQ